jgi:hydrogenase/urease accessory protein HupE
MKKFIRSVTAVMVASSSQIALAHTGHGADGGSFSLVHYLTEPEHLSVIAVIVVGVLLVIRKKRKNREE